MGIRRTAAALVLAAFALAACDSLDSDVVSDIHDATGVDVTDPTAAVGAAASGGTTGNAAEDPVLDATRALRRVTYEKRGDDAMDKARQESRTIGYAAAAGEYEKALRWVTPGDRGKERELQLKYGDANLLFASSFPAGAEQDRPITVAERNAYLTSAQAYGRAAQLSSSDADKAAALEKRTVAYWNAGDTGRSCDSIRDYLALRPGDPKPEAFRQRNCR